jgi:2-polyprenyl-3-methyl-5-hydroxy-6-metoxy-1,4-benzoquinol methylase
MLPNDESSKKLSEQELKLNEYLTWVAEPSVDNMVFLQHLSRYEFFAKRTISSPDMMLGTSDLSEINLKGIKILDVGCGEGFGSYFLAKLGARVTGLDWNEEVIDRAQKIYPLKDLMFVTGDACNLSFTNDSFDAVCAMDLIEHLAKPEKFIAEAKRVLIDNGLLMFSTPNHLKHLIETGKIYPFHEREYLYTEFMDFAEKHFDLYELYGQCPDWIDNICESMRQRDFHQAPFLIIAGVKLLAFMKMVVPEIIKTRLHEKRRQLELNSIKLEQIRENEKYNSITFVQERYETCSDFILTVFREDIRSSIR